MERVGKNEPAARVLGRDAGLAHPIAGADIGLDVARGEMEAVQFRAGQMKEGQREACVALDFVAGGDEGVARAADEQGGVRVEADDFERLTGGGVKRRRHENKAECGRPGGHALAQLRGKLDEGLLIERPGQVAGRGVPRRQLERAAGVRRAKNGPAAFPCPTA